MTILNNTNGIIFGSTGLIGSNLAIKLGQLDANLILHGNSVKKLKNLDDKFKKMNKKTILMPADITKDEFYEKLLGTVSSRFQKIDFLINLIGRFIGLKPLTHLSYKEWHTMYELNLLSFWRVIKELEPLLRKSKRAKVIFLNNKKISEGKAYHNTLSIFNYAKYSLLKVFEKENKKFNIQTHMIEVPQLNLGLTLPLGGEKNTSQRFVEESVQKIIEKISRR